VVFIATTHLVAVWGRLLARGAPDSPVRRHVTQPLGLEVV
jgi:hypothetical protein